MTGVMLKETPVFLNNRHPKITEAKLYHAILIGGKEDQNRKPRICMETAIAESAATTKKTPARIAGALVAMLFLEVSGLILG